jgi:hypothetical protein
VMRRGRHRDSACAVEGFLQRSRHLKRRKASPENSFIPQVFELFDLFWLTARRALDWGHAWFEVYCAH